jgi:hypothetical protein
LIKKRGFVFHTVGIPRTVSLKHNQRDARFERLQSATYRMPLFNDCTLYQIRFSIFLFVCLGYSGTFQVR